MYTSISVHTSTYLFIGLSIYLFLIDWVINRLVGFLLRIFVVFLFPEVGTRPGGGNEGEEANKEVWSMY